MKENLLDVTNLKIYYNTKYGYVKAVDDIEFKIFQGEKVGLIGESGAGKSVTGRGILNLIRTPPGEIKDGKIYFKEKNLLNISNNELRKVRGNNISMIFQEATESLNPVFTVGSQLIDAYQEHHKVDEAEAREEAVKALEKVQIPDAQKRLNDYPHQFSGGMQQRVMIALSLINDPDLLIADEPTTALDVTTEANIIKLLSQVTDNDDRSVILITHDLAVAAEFCDRVIIMYAGKIVESGKVEDIFNRPRHPYTESLVKSIIDVSKTPEEIAPIPGSPPDPVNKPEGCLFHPRCKRKLDKCTKKFPEDKKAGTKWRYACYKPLDARGEEIYE